MHRMKIDKMISELDTACGMLIVASMKDSTIRQAMEKISKVSIALGLLGQKFNNCSMDMKKIVK